MGKLNEEISGEGMEVSKFLSRLRCTRLTSASSAPDSMLVMTLFSRLRRVRLERSSRCARVTTAIKFSLKLNHHNTVETKLNFVI